MSDSCASFVQIFYPDRAVKQDSSQKVAHSLIDTLPSAINTTIHNAECGDDEGSAALLAAASSAKGTTSRVESIQKGTPLAGSENSVAEGLSESGSSPMDLDSDCQGVAEVQFETGTALEPPSTSPIQRQTPEPTAPDPGSMDVDSDVQDRPGSQDNNLISTLTGRSRPTNVVTRTKFSAGRHKTSAVKTKSIANSSSPSSTESDTDTPEGDSDTQEQRTYRLHAGRSIKPLMATATASRTTPLRHKLLRFVAKPKSAPSGPVKHTRPSASKAKGMNRQLENKEVLKRKGEVLEEKAPQPIDFIDLTTDSWLRQSLTDDMEVLKAWHFSI